MSTVGAVSLEVLVTLTGEAVRGGGTGGSQVTVVVSSVTELFTGRYRCAAQADGEIALRSTGLAAT